MDLRWKRILWLQVGGAAINLLAAWAIVVCIHNTGPHWQTAASGWPHPVSADWPPATHVNTGPGAFGFRNRSTVGIRRGTASGPEAAEIAVINQFAAGWPVPCWRWEVWLRWEESPRISPRKESSAGIPTPSIWQNGIDPPDEIFHFSRYGWKRLPLHPGPLGFAVNTVFHAAVLWCVVLLAIAARRAIRRRMLRHRFGLCPACRYPIGVSAICPECGQPVQPAASAVACKSPSAEP